MRHVKIIAAKCLPLSSELLMAFLTVDILWQLLCERQPFSMWIYLLSGIGMAVGNYLFLLRRRRLWQIALLNVVICAIWISALTYTLDRTYPPLLIIQIPMYVLPIWRGYYWGVTPVTTQRLHTYLETVGLFCLFYFIVFSFFPPLAKRIPPLLAMLVLDLLTSVLMRTSGRNTIRAGGVSLGHLPAFLLPIALAAAAAALGAGLLVFRGELLPLLQAVGAAFTQALYFVVRVLSSLFQGRSTTAESSSTASEGTDVPLQVPVEESSLLTQILTWVMLAALAALVLALIACLLYCLWQLLHRERSSVAEEADDELTRRSLRRPRLLSRVRNYLRVRSFLIRYRGTPRAALLELEKWGVLHRCRRQSRETPREYLKRLVDGPLQGHLEQSQLSAYQVLIEDVDRSLYGGLPPCLSREQVQKLLSAVRRARLRTSES